MSIAPHGHSAANATAFAVVRLNANLSCAELDNRVVGADAVTLSHPALPQLIQRRASIRVVSGQAAALRQLLVRRARSVRTHSLGRIAVVPRVDSVSAGWSMLGRYRNRLAAKPGVNVTGSLFPCPTVPHFVLRAPCLRRQTGPIASHHACVDTAIVYGQTRTSSSDKSILPQRQHQ